MVYLIEVKTAIYSLALHTTSSQLGLSINNFNNDSRCQTWDLGRNLSNYLHQYLTEFLQPQTWKDLEYIAIAKGPGSFTSTRIGVVTARTIAQQLNIPLFAISSLAALVWSQKEKFAPQTLLAVQMEASRGQLFVAIYKVGLDNLSLQEYLPDTTMKPQVWQEYLDNLETTYQLIKAPVNLGNTVDSLMELAYLQWQKGDRPLWSDVLPFYGQHPV